MRLKAIPPAERAHLPETADTPHPIDALLPPEMARRAEAVGVAKASTDPATVLLLAVLAGAFIALGAVLATVVATGAGTIGWYGAVRLVTGVAFSLGLILVLVSGAELFTGNNLIVMAWASRRITTGRLLRNWALVYIGNFVGALGIAALVCMSNHHALADGQVAATAIGIARHKVALGFVDAVVLGALCNVLVCLAVWMTFSARTTTDRILAIVPPITAFVACGFEHSVANMYFVPAALLLDPAALPNGAVVELTWTNFLFKNLLPVTLGNTLGGSLLVGGVYWWIYLRRNRSRTKG